MEARSIEERLVVVLGQQVAGETQQLRNDAFCHFKNQTLNSAQLCVMRVQCSQLLLSRARSYLRAHSSQILQTAPVVLSVAAAAAAAGPVNDSLGWPEN